MEIINKTDYQAYKAQLDAELTRASEGFVRIGYLLKVARDTDVLEESGYGTVTEFAYAEYGLDKTQVSRFIRINDKFSEGGNSDKLDSRYQGFGYAKLAVMLHLPEALIQELSPKYTKSEILAIKEEVDAERAVSDIERWLEKEPAEVEETMLEKMIQLLGESHPELYREIWEAGRQGLTEEALQIILAPAGQKTYSERVQGNGRMMLTLKDKDEGGSVAIVSLRTGDKDTYSWAELLRAVERLLVPGKTAKESWEVLYQKPAPEELEAADGRRQKQTKVSKARQEPQPAAVIRESGQEAELREAGRAAGVQEDVEALTDEEIPGQMNVEQFFSPPSDKAPEEWKTLWNTAMQSCFDLYHAMEDASDTADLIDMQKAHLEAENLADEIKAAIDVMMETDREKHTAK